MINVNENLNKKVLDKISLELILSLSCQGLKLEKIKKIVEHLFWRNIFFNLKVNLLDLKFRFLLKSLESLN